MSSETRPDRVVIKADWSQWHSVAFFSRKMISVETCYKTHDGKLLAIVKAFKIWWHYLEDCKHKVLVLTNYNKLRPFMIWKAWAPNKSVGPKSSFATTFALIIYRTKRMELQMLHHNTFSKMPKKKLPFKPKTLRSYTDYNSSWPTFLAFP